MVVDQKAYPPEEYPDVDCSGKLREYFECPLCHTEVDTACHPAAKIQFKGQWVLAHKWCLRQMSSLLGVAFKPVS